MEEEGSNTTEMAVPTSTGASLLQPQHHYHHQAFTLGGRMGSYIWVHKGESSYLKGGFLFEAKGSNDITVGFSVLADPPNLDPSYQHVAYEIVLGGWLNIKSALRKFGSEVAYVTKQQRGSDAVIESTANFFKYWIVLDDGLIIIGKGGGTDVREILRWRDPFPVRIRSLGLTTWNTPIQFRSILFEPLSSFTSEVNLDLLATTTTTADDSKSDSIAPTSNDNTRLHSSKSSSQGTRNRSSSSFSNLKDGWKDFYSKALESEIFADAEIVFNNSKESIFAHRTLLFSVPYFRRILLQDEARLRQTRMLAPQVIQLNEVTNISGDVEMIRIPHVVMKMLLNFIYTGELSFQNTTSDDSNLIFGMVVDVAEGEPKTMTLRSLAQATSYHRLLEHIDLFHLRLSPNETILAADSNLRPSASHPMSRDRRPKEHNFKTILKNAYFSDVTFVLRDGKTVPAHRIILASWSDFFKALFTNGMRESSQQEIRLEEASYSAFNLMMAFMYSGGKDIVSSLDKIQKVVGNIVDADETATELIVELLLLSDQFGIPQLKGHCIRALYNNLTINNACQLVCFADDMELAQFREHCLSFIEGHFSSISKTDLFLELPFHILLEITLSDDLIASSEVEIFNALIAWIEHGNRNIVELQAQSSASTVEKESQAEQLLGSIRYPLMDKDFLVKLESEYALIKQSCTLRSLVQNYLREEPSVNQSSIPPTFRAALPVLDEEDFRKKTRTVSCLKELRFVACGDENGVFYYFGTNFGKAPWTNPHKANRVTIRLSGPTSRYSAPEFIVSRSFKTTCHTTGYPPWFSVDLGKYSLIATHYTLCHDGSDNYLRNWCLQGANKNDEWVELKIHKEDETIYRSGQFASFKLPYNKQTMTPYRMFRILMTGPSTTGQSNILSCSGFELYGYLI